MNFNFTDEQQQFADALRRYLDKHYGFEARQAIVRSDAGISKEHGSAFAELGLTALPVPEAQGGFNGGTVDMLVVMQELGRALVVEPYWATAVGIEALKLSGTGEGDDAALLERAAQGEIRLAVAFHEPDARYDLFSIDTTATRQGDGYTLSGTKSVVQHGAQADFWIVPARLDGEVALFVVTRDAANTQITDYRTIDGQRAATLAFNATPARKLNGKHAGAAALEHIADYGIVLLCSEAIGALDALNHATVEYTKTRQQFGVPIARFQALQHRMAEMVVAKEMALSMAYVAAAALTEPDARARRRMIAAAKLETARAGRFLSQCAVQLHGGMGMTDELEVGDFFKRLTVIELLFGDSAEQLAVLEETA